MGMQVHRQLETVPQCAHELGGGGGSKQAGHVLDREDVGAGLDDLLRKSQVVVEGVQLLARVEKVAGVAERTALKFEGVASNIAMFSSARSVTKFVSSFIKNFKK